MKVIWSFALCMGCLCVSAPWAEGAPPISAGDSSEAALVTMQAQPASNPVMDKDAVARGEIWFYQRCALCHMERIVKDELYKPLAPSLKGLLKDASPGKAAVVLAVIKVGTLRMPGFQYGLDAKEFDELIAFLKTH